MKNHTLYIITQLFKFVKLTFLVASLTMYKLIFLPFFQNLVMVVRYR